MLWWDHTTEIHLGIHHWLIYLLINWLGLTMFLIRKGHVQQPPNHFDTSLKKNHWNRNTSRNNTSARKRRAVLIDAEEFNHNGSRKWPDTRSHIFQSHAWDVWRKLTTWQSYLTVVVCLYIVISTIMWGISQNSWWLTGTVHPPNKAFMLWLLPDLQTKAG